MHCILPFSVPAAIHHGSLEVAGRRSASRLTASRQRLSNLHSNEHNHASDDLPGASDARPASASWSPTAALEQQVGAQGWGPKICPGRPLALRLAGVEFGLPFPVNHSLILLPTVVVINVTSNRGTASKLPAAADRQSLAAGVPDALGRAKWATPFRNPAEETMGVVTKLVALVSDSRATVHKTVGQKVDSRPLNFRRARLSLYVLSDFTAAILAAIS